MSAREAFASGSPAGHVAVTSAPCEHPHAGWLVLHFAVPMNADGVRIANDWQAHGMRATGSHTVICDDVFVPDSAIALSRPRGEFHPIWNVVITVAMPLIAGVNVGVAERAAAIALDVVGRREDPTVQSSIGEMRSALMVAAALHERRVARAADLRFTPSLELTSELLALKSEIVEQTQRSVDAAVEAGWRRVLPTHGPRAAAARRARRPLSPAPAQAAAPLQRPPRARP